MTQNNHSNVSHSTSVEYCCQKHAVLLDIDPVKEARQGGSCKGLTIGRHYNGDDFIDTCAQVLHFSQH